MGIQDKMLRANCHMQHSVSVGRGGGGKRRAAEGSPASPSLLGSYDHEVNVRRNHGDMKESGVFLKSLQPGLADVVETWLASQDPTSRQVSEF